MRNFGDRIQAQRSKAIFSARFSSSSFDRDSEPRYWVSSDFRKLTTLSQAIQLGFFSPSSGPTATCVDSPSPLVNTGAQMTVENRESIRVFRLTTTKLRYCLGSPCGLKTR